MNPDKKQIIEAGFRLGKYLIEKQEAISALLGCKPIETPTGPSTYSALVEAFSVTKGRELPVSAAHSDRTIFGTATANIAFRFWHDVLHIFHDQDFSRDAEIVVGAMHVEDIRRAFGNSSLEARIMEADTIGQTLYNDVKGKFPSNQADFAVNYVLHGLGHILTTWTDS